MREFNIIRDKQGAVTYAPQLADPSDSIFQVRLAADTPTTLTVPTNGHVALVSGSDHYFVGESAITLPASGTFTAGVGEQNRSQIDVTDVTTLNFRARNACDITVVFFS